MAKMGRKGEKRVDTARKGLKEVSPSWNGQKMADVSPQHKRTPTSAQFCTSHHQDVP